MIDEKTEIKQKQKNHYNVGKDNPMYGKVSPNRGKRGLCKHTLKWKNERSNCQKGKNNTFYGHHHSDKFINEKKLLRGNKNPNYKGGNITLICKICNKKFEVYPHQKDIRRCCSIKCAGIWRSHYIRGKRHHAYGKSPHHKKRVYYKNICMRSTWEANIAKWLDKQGWEWKYEPKRFELKDRTYLPDFYLPMRNIYWETKGWFKNSDQETTRQFRELYPNENLLVLTKSIYEAIINVC